MKSGILIRLIEDEYESLASTVPEDDLFRPAYRNLFSGSGRDEDVARFKAWLKYVMKSSELGTQDLRIKPEEVIMYAVSKVSPEEPDEPMHPLLVKTLALHTPEELEELLGWEQRDKVLGLLKSYNLDCNRL